eukprot:scpid106575/ scgid21564/ 
MSTQPDMCQTRKQTTVLAGLLKKAKGSHVGGSNWDFRRSNTRGGSDPVISHLILEDGGIPTDAEGSVGLSLMQTVIFFSMLHMREWHAECYFANIREVPHN